MIYCIWYPSGGFGHFVNALFSLHGQGFDRPKQSLVFSPSGDSHNLDLNVPKFYKNQWLGSFEFNPDKNYSVLVDNGINDENDDFKRMFPGATVIKICYSDTSWPIVAATMIKKAMKSSVDRELTVERWDSTEDWVKREKYFLFLRDHALRQSWKPVDQKFLYIDELIDYEKLFNKLSTFVEIEPFEKIWNTWRTANSAYIDPVVNSVLAIEHIKSDRTFDLQHIVSTWDQAVFYYHFWLEFGIEVPHNDFAVWPRTTDQFKALI